MSNRRLRILTWHLHGNYLYYLTQVPHDFYIVTKPGHPAGYAGKIGNLPWGNNFHEIPYDQIKNAEFDCVLYQSRHHYEKDRIELLSAAQQNLPQIYLEHDPPQEHPTNTKHWVQDKNMLLIHVTSFNALMWDSGITPSKVIEHGVMVPKDIRYLGDRAEGIVVVNNLNKRGRRLGADIYEYVRNKIPLSLVGMDAQSLPGGMGEIPNNELAYFVAHYRFFFNPIRYTSLGLSIIEAMMTGVPVIGLATTELVTVIENERNGYVHTDVDKLIQAMQRLIKDPAMAQRWGEEGKRYAQQRFGIQRFVKDWSEVFKTVTQ
jgi:hypothetical protein